MKPSFIAIVLYPFFFVGFSGLPICKGRDICNYFKGLMLIFFMGIGYGVGGGGIFNLLMICYMSLLTISIFICFVLFYLFIFYYYCKLSHIRVCGFLVFVCLFF